MADRDCLDDGMLIVQRCLLLRVLVGVGRCLRGRCGGGVGGGGDDDDDDDDDEKNPPFANHQHLYNSIDAISEGDAPWTTLSMESVEADTLPLDDLASVPTWKRATYELVFRDPQAILDHQISNPDFKDHIDYTPRLMYGDNGQRVWSDFMTGNWAWSQCVSEFQ